MLNFRKLKQDFSSAIVKEGKSLFDDKKVLSAKILHLDHKTIKVSGRIVGQFENVYESELEIARSECETIDSDCDCPYHYDCHHLAALIFYLEQHLDKILVAYSKENSFEALTKESDIDDEVKEELLEKVKVAATKEEIRQQEQCQKQLLQEYVASSSLLSGSPFFQSCEKRECDKAEIALIITPPAKEEIDSATYELQIALRIPFRSKPLFVPQVKAFLEALRYDEPIFIGGRRYNFSLFSFDLQMRSIVQTIVEHATFPTQVNSEKSQRIALVNKEIFGVILSQLYDLATRMQPVALREQGDQEEELQALPGIFWGSLDAPLRFASQRAALRFTLEYIKPPVSKILLKPLIHLGGSMVKIEEVSLFDCAKPGMIHNQSYYRFPVHITRKHLHHLGEIRDMTIPEPLFGTFVENALPEFAKVAEIHNQQEIEHFVTIPYVGAVEASCDLSYLNGELEATLSFHYGKQKIPSAYHKITYEDVSSFVTEQGILARNLVEERKIVEDLFQDFTFLPEQGIFVSKSDKKIVEFMADVIPRNQHRVTFHCPQNLLDQFIYDKTDFTLHLSHTNRIDQYRIEMKVNGALQGVRMDMLWECMASKRAFIELDAGKSKGKKGEGSRGSKILILDLDRLSGVIQLFDEMGIEVLNDHKLERPLWSLANIDESQFEGMPVVFSMTPKLKEIREQMLGKNELTFSAVPKEIHASLRNYQEEGVHWLERLRSMYLNGILADDMGLGKTVQAIVAFSQIRKKNKAPALIVCPTSLLYNWKEEFAKFYPKAKVQVVDGVPLNRKKMIEGAADLDAIITSYTLLQKDIELYQAILFSYVFLDEAQHIKNRGTRNAKSVKMIQAEYRLILTGTPIENSLDELWSLFDFLMPGFLSTYERFVEKYVRVTGFEQAKNLDYLRKKIAPFILRRMKEDVLKDLPPVSENVYHCQLSDTQRELYRSYAQSARDELVKLVERDGFDRVQIHVLATLTRLKQICCHPAIFAKEKAEVGDSAKYDMLLELLQTLIEGNHKTVIFSQYTQMLQIMRVDLQKMGIRFAYLDGTTKNRLEVVKQFNEDEQLSVFLVSLKAGGTGLNLVGADTVIHYDMWWNPAVENQATDRVHRIGQKKSVSTYKLITLNTIEEKIAEMQQKKKGLVKKVVTCDDEALMKLTWEDVLELLKT